MQKSFTHNNPMTTGFSSDECITDDEGLDDKKEAFTGLEFSRPAIDQCNLPIVPAHQVGWEGGHDGNGGHDNDDGIDAHYDGDDGDGNHNNDDGHDCYFDFVGNGHISAL